jgi:uncharacterized membrane protein
LALGGINIGVGVALQFVQAYVSGVSVLQLMSGTFEPALALTSRFWMVYLVALPVTLTLTLVSYVAPSLIILHDQPTWTAMKMSVVGCLKNILPGIVYIGCIFVLTLVSIILLLLGLLVAIPLEVITVYTIYRDIFVEDLDERPF